MALKSYLLADNARLNACLSVPSAHVLQGDRGEHVQDIQIALQFLDGAVIASLELDTSLYGPTTAAAVLAYKTKRKIINRAYQSKPDDIVGQMTIAAIDREMIEHQSIPTPRRSRYHCANGMCMCNSG